MTKGKKLVMAGRAFYKNRHGNQLVHRVLNHEPRRCLIQRPGTRKAQAFWAPTSKLSLVAA